MAKELKAKISLDTKTAEKAIQNLNSKLRTLDRAVQNSANSKLEQSLMRAVGAESQLKNAVDGVNRSQKDVNRNAKKHATIIDQIITKLKWLASVYLGVMGMKAMLNTADTITGAENQLNYLNSQSLGDKGKNSNGGYSLQTLKQTQSALDKIYATAQRARTGYTDMLSNVSKTMTLAGNAFDNNIDNAIKFQEVMAKAYKVSGASAAEQASSMYQLTQALASGTLQGDELRSVREGASLAYKQIEKFAQGVYNTTDSLKEMGSQGKITSDIVVAAILNSEKTIDQAFKNSAITFADAWTRIKNTAVKAFEPLAQALTKLLNSSLGKGLITGITIAINVVASALTWLVNFITNVVNVIADNWNWLKYIFIAVFSVLLIYATAAITKVAIHLALLAAQAVVTGLQMFWSFLTGASPIYAIVLILGVLLSIIALVGGTTMQTCQVIGYALFYIGEALVLIGMLTGNIAMIAGAVAMLIIGYVLTTAKSFTDAFGIITGGLYVVGAVFQNTGALIGNIVVALTNSLVAFASNVKTLFIGVGKVIQSFFYGIVAKVLGAISSIAEALNALPFIDFNISGLSSKASSYASKAAEAAGYKANYKDIGAAFNSGLNTFSYKGLGDAYSKGYGVGTKFAKNVTSKLAGLQNKLTSIGNINAGALATTIDPSSIGNLGGTGGNGRGSGSGSGGKGGSDDTSKIKDNTDDIVDYLELSENELKYLRDIAEMEWKKEYTMPQITINMTNNNNVANNTDLDGIVTKLTDKMYQALATTASGVY